jgi:hypothetical protein
LATLETFNILIIPLINHRNQPLDQIFASLGTLRNGFFCTFVRKHKFHFHFLKTFTLLKNKNQTFPIYLLCCSSFCRSSAKFLLIALHLVAPMP